MDSPEDICLRTFIQSNKAMTRFHPVPAVQDKEQKGLSG
jgi:hypothetical protein